MEELVSWIAVAYDGNENVLMPFKTKGDKARAPKEVLNALMIAYPDVTYEIAQVCAVIEVAPGVSAQPNLTISQESDTLWAADIAP